MAFVRESSIVFRRQIRMNLRNPAWVLIGAFQPVLYLLLFGPLLKPLVTQFGATNAYTFFVPGMTPSETDAAIDAIVRLVLSHVMQPGGEPARTAEHLAWIVARVLGREPV